MTIINNIRAIFARASMHAARRREIVRLARVRDAARWVN